MSKLVMAWFVYGSYGFVSFGDVGLGLVCSSKAVEASHVPLACVKSSCARGSPGGACHVKLL